ncbi:putative ATP-dependent RNA helicase [Trypanosoma grayi]|uniref:putative ATP-dependent RNA helicase n=1 Tax=Trypanosoma grayi TaxID=71804 RepID=UPI0004F4103F|nr:putative ATP-dependent RNA helicase [Trypanosoma grayi]KEG09783.1 putative ATP-dependent RNA helicase [Trypanosoma grayi]
MRRVLGVAPLVILQRRTCCLRKETELVRITCDHIYRSSSAREELRQLIHESSVENALCHLDEFSKDVCATAGPAWLAKLSEAPDALARISIVVQTFEKWYIARKAPQKVTMHEPWGWYPKARYMRRRFIYHYGPTNSGKTHAALEALVKAKSGVYCAPLKALAAQVWKRIDTVVPCDLLIGDERRFGGGAEHVSCTVEMTPIDYQVDVGAIDEVQMIADRDRGWAWTRALLGLPAREIHLCGEERAIPLIRNLLYKTYELRGLELVTHKRLVPLEVSPSLGGDLRRVENGDCVVCFSRRAIFDMKRRLERIPGVVPHCIYGSMPFAVREAQASAFNNGVQTVVQGENLKKHVLVSTDAIAYGLNMSIERIVFATMKKFDGKQKIDLPQATAVQIAGRAGRFGMTRANAVGRCTTLHREDFSMLRDAVSSRLPPLQKAGLLPTADILELFVSLRAEGKMPRAAGETQVTFYERIKEFTGCCHATDVFFPCDLSRSLLQIAKELEAVPGLVLSDRILFCYVPLNERSEEAYSLLRAFARDHAAGRPVRLRIDEEYETLARQSELLRENWDERRAQQVLARMEYLYRQAEVYCWLAWRFGKTFVHLEAGTALKERVAAKMEELLQRL